MGPDWQLKDLVGGRIPKFSRAKRAIMIDIEIRPYLVEAGGLQPIRRSHWPSIEVLHIVSRLNSSKTAVVNRDQVWNRLNTYTLP